MTLFKTFTKSINPEHRRPEALTDADYDHEIQLVDHSSLPRTPSQAPSNVANEQDTPNSIPSPKPRSSVRKKTSLLKEVAHRSVRSKKSSQQQDILEGSQDVNRSTSKLSATSKTPLIKTTQPPEDADGKSAAQAEITATEELEEANRGRKRSRSYGATKLQKEVDNQSHIDVLYENQRGCFLCGMPFFSFRALGNLDPAPWTNEFHKPSPTDITTAQVPDPTWTWSWKEWKINHENSGDKDGFEYSFMFAKMFSWHGPSWWNSFVRRRAWIRKRVKKHAERHVQESHMLNADYFTIHPKRNVSRSSRGSSRTGQYSVTALAKQEMEQEAEKEDIINIGQLMDVLLHCRIDREKMEAVENFIMHGGDDLYYLREKMHDIMAQFIFQVSRRILLAHLLQMSDEATEHRKKHQEQAKPENKEEKQRIDNLQAAIKHAEEEVMRLEFWSDQKEMVEKGETVGAVDNGKNWGYEWEGLDNSAPKDVISQRGRVTSEGEKSMMSDLQLFETPPERRVASPISSMEKGKGKAMD